MFIYQELPYCNEKCSKQLFYIQLHPFKYELTRWSQKTLKHNISPVLKFPLNFLFMILLIEPIASGGERVVIGDLSISRL